MIVDLFAGPGGWTEGLWLLGESDIGIEHDETACRTRAAASHLTIRADVTTFPLERLAGRVDGLIASPPCTDFSVAGHSAGIEGKTGRLMFEVPRWVEALRPRWVACEQVPPALEWWERFAGALELLGYRSWTGILNAADYGVPQTRRRAFLLASLDHQPRPPEPTHDRNPHPTLFGPELQPWVSMAQALGWGMTTLPYPTIASGRTTGGPDREKVGGSSAREVIYREQGEGRWVRDSWGEPDLDYPGREESRWKDTEAEPSPAVTSKARSWLVTTRGNTGRSTDDFSPEGRPSRTFTAKSYSWVVQTGNNSMVTGREGSRAGDGDVELYERTIDEPAPTLDAKAGAAWRVVGVNTGRDWKEGGTREDAQSSSPDEPAPAIDGKGRWHALIEVDDVTLEGWDDRPATTVQGDPRLWPPGHKVNQADIDRIGEERARAYYGDRAGGDAIRLGIADALVLQSFPPDYPVQGTKTKQFEQIGNAVPPLLAAHVLAAVMGDRQ